MGKLDGYHDIDQDEDEDMEYYADVHGYEDDEPEPVELTDAEVIARLKDALTAANARIAELEAQVELLTQTPEQRFTAIMRKIEDGATGQGLDALIEQARECVYMGSPYSAEMADYLNRKVLSQVQP